MPIACRCVALIGARDTESELTCNHWQDRDVTKLRSLRQASDIMVGAQGSVAKLLLKKRGTKETVALYVRRMVPARIWSIYLQASRALPELRTALNRTGRQSVPSPEQQTRELQACMGSLQDHLVRALSSCHL